MSNLSNRIEKLEKAEANRGANRPVYVTYEGGDLLSLYMKLQEHTDQRTWADAVAATGLGDPFARMEDEAVANANAKSGIAVVYSPEIERENSGDRSSAKLEAFRFLGCLIKALEARGRDIALTDRERKIIVPFRP